MKTTILSLILAAAQASVFARDDAAENYVAHEWGTFTSVQGADGVQREWNPLTVVELPSFVYDLSKPTGNPRRVSTAFSSKSVFRTLQRLETPVIYFYSDRERSVDVTVRFPQGIVTEWYPQAHDIGPSWVRPRELFSEIDRAAQKIGLRQINLSSFDTRNSIKQSLIHWADVKLLPAKTAPADPLPGDASGSHYYAARETDADILRVKARANGASTEQSEKFLFYRGVGSFSAPLQVTTAGEADYILLRNTGTDDLRHLFVLQVRGSEGKFIHVDRLPAGGNESVKLDPGKNLLPLADLKSDLGTQISRALAGAGLYEREAVAMVKTWRDSWFEEQGVRVLYVLPRGWTDGVLPIRLDPPPRELVRVMVGRAELITPAMEWEVLKQIVRYSEADAAEKRKIIEETRGLGLGRFAEPTVHKVLGNTPSSEFSKVASELLAATGEPVPKHDRTVARR